ncbi:MAG: hypothetical protein OMM_06185 [Candidatus Magnetoglobus multicellularis str. Araruama]|uniref:Uncharacterized protein n=1 Tax=Candidatus Magnetoglobus multicellularis str. Araruama TaxID=890399 RepID=A0A1V1PIT7_9BACT|nr:MAG: hypothetical protein OMM_06185 [Candidatus Magnetoglobus multicellularis str. Araruama]
MTCILKQFHESASFLSLLGLGTEKSKPIVEAFDSMVQIFEKKQEALDHQQKLIDKQQSTLDNQEAVIHEIKEDFEKYKNGNLDRKTEIKKDLLIELSTKADIEKMNGKIFSLFWLHSF